MYDRHDCSTSRDSIYVAERLWKLSGIFDKKMSGVVSTLENDSNISEIDRIQTRPGDGTEPIQASEMPERSISAEIPRARRKTAFQ